MAKDVAVKRCIWSCTLSFRSARLPVGSVQSKMLLEVCASCPPIRSMSADRAIKSLIARAQRLASPWLHKRRRPDGDTIRATGHRLVQRQIPGGRRQNTDEFRWHTRIREFRSHCYSVTLLRPELRQYALELEGEEADVFQAQVSDAAQSSVVFVPPRRCRR